MTIEEREAFVGLLASLSAAISLLERTPNAKKAAASNNMFAQMIADYKRSLEHGRTTLKLSDLTQKLR